MQRFEYKVVPAPKKGVKAKGIRATEDRFANALEGVMNKLGSEGWDYVRTDTLPCEERVGLTGRTTNYQNMLVFRRLVAEVTARAPVAVPEVKPLALNRPIEKAEDIVASPSLPGATRDVPDIETKPAEVAAQ